MRNVLIFIIDAKEKGDDLHQQWGKIDLADITFTQGMRLAILNKSSFGTFGEASESFYKVLTDMFLQYIRKVTVYEMAPSLGSKAANSYETVNSPPKSTFRSELEHCQRTVSSFQKSLIKGFDKLELNLEMGSSIALSELDSLLEKTSVKQADRALYRFLSRSPLYDQFKKSTLQELRSIIEAVILPTLSNKEKGRYLKNENLTGAPLCDVLTALSKAFSRFDDLAIRALSEFAERDLEQRQFAGYKGGIALLAALADAIQYRQQIKKALVTYCA